MALKVKRNRRNTSDKETSIAEVQKEGTKRLNVEIPKSRHAALKRLAVDLETTIGDLVNKWIDEGLKQYS